MTPTSTLPVLDAVHDFGVDPTGTTDSLAAWNACFAVAKKEGRTVHYPGGGSVSVVSDTIDAPFGLTLVGDGGRIAMMPGRSMPGVKTPNWQQGRHLLHVHDAATAVLRDIVFDYQGALQPHCVGDIVRATRVGHVDMAACRELNMHGETTKSSATMPETFALQLLHVDTYLIDGCDALATDGADTATAIVAHWCGVGTIRNTLVLGHVGQAFGTYGVGPKGGKLTLENLTSIRNGHGVNIEGGNAGGLDVVIGGPTTPVRTIQSTKASVNVNGNPAAPGHILVGGLWSLEDARLFSREGTPPASLDIEGLVRV